MLDWVLNTTLSCQSMFESIFSLMMKFLLHSEITAKLKNGRQKFQENRTIIIQVDIH